MRKRRNTVEWVPGDPITEDADSERREFSPDIGDDDREEYEERLWVIRTGLGHVLSQKQIHDGARSHVLGMRWNRYQRKLGALKAIEAAQHARRNTRLGKTKLCDVPDMILEVAYAKHKTKTDWLRHVTEDVIAHTGEAVSGKTVRAELRKRRIAERST